MVNLPVIPHPQPTLEEQDNFGPHLLSSIVANTLLLSGFAKPVCYKTVADVSNKNLLGPQRELIQWHPKLCININLVQELMLNPMLISLVSSKTITEKKI